MTNSISNRTHYTTILIVIVFILLLVITWQNINYNFLKTNSNSVSPKYYERLNSFMLSKKVEGRFISNLHLKNVITKKKSSLDLQKPTIILLLSNFGCSPCQKRELEIYRDFYSKYSNHIKVVAIFNSTDYLSILKLRKTLRLNFTLYSANNELFAYYSIINKYPQILFIIKNQVVSSFLPLPDDDELSSWYLSNIINSIPFFLEDSIKINN